MFFNILDKYFRSDSSSPDAVTGTPIWAPVSGKILLLEDVPDAVFSQKILGDGLAVIPSLNHIYAPFDGEIITAFPTGHAIGIRSADGIECLIHIGIDTVALNGRGFRLMVSQGQFVQKGSILVEIDLAYIKKSGKSAITPVIITNPQHWKVKFLHEVGEIHAKQDRLFVVERQ